MVVVNMNNHNALIAMVQVSQNADNPYVMLCEYIKYCMFVNSSESMMLTEIREAVGDEFGINIPHNVLLKCLSLVVDEGIISEDHHRFKRVGQFDTVAFDNKRTEFRTIEANLIDALVQYVAKYNRMWTKEYAREKLIDVLDGNGLAYEIFIYNRALKNDDSEFSADIGDSDNCIDIGNDERQLYSDVFFVGKFIEEVLSRDSVEKDYLQRVCEGLMLCAGSYQLPDKDTMTSSPRIKGTSFFFDTKLLLRFIGCAGKAAVEAARELVNLIQKAGGNICYYPQTLEEMKCAFDNAVFSLSNGFSPKDDEMRLYASSINNNITVIKSKKASLKKELEKSDIYLRGNDWFTDDERIHCGFDCNDLQQYMSKRVNWERQTIENDALAIWETHMRRQGNYGDYFGTSKCLPVFVTTNSLLVTMALSYRRDRSNTKGVREWNHNHLPVITDIRLTCRLWSPSEDLQRLTILYLTANAVAAQRPTPYYLNRIRELAIELKESVPEYSEIYLPEFFDDNVTDALLEKTRGTEAKLNIGNFASTIGEITEWKLKENEEVTNRVIKERDNISKELDRQKRDIIDGAINRIQNKLGFSRIVLSAILLWPLIVLIIVTGISSWISYISGNWDLLWFVLCPIVLAVVEYFVVSNFFKRWLLKKVLPKVEERYTKRIINKLIDIEKPYKGVITEQVKLNTPLLVKCRNTINK